MEEITKEDVYILITSYALQKMGFLFQDGNTDGMYSDDFDTYTTADGKEYGKWDVPVFLVLYGLAKEQSVAEIALRCLQNLGERDFIIDLEKINSIIEVAKEKCKSEINAILETDMRFARDEDPIEIFNYIKHSLGNEYNDF